MIAAGSPIETPSDTEVGHGPRTIIRTSALSATIRDPPLF
jgi:hypothetical protein